MMRARLRGLKGSTAEKTPPHHATDAPARSPDRELQYRRSPQSKSKSQSAADSRRVIDTPKYNWYAARVKDFFIRSGCEARLAHARRVEAVVLTRIIKVFAG